jgi:hypothetical protein
VQEPRTTCCWWTCGPRASTAAGWRGCSSWLTSPPTKTRCPATNPRWSRGVCAWVPPPSPPADSPRRISGRWPNSSTGAPPQRFCSPAPRMPEHRNWEALLLYSVSGDFVFVLSGSRVFLVRQSIDSPVYRSSANFGWEGQRRLSAVSFIPCIPLVHQQSCYSVYLESCEGDSRTSICFRHRCYPLAPSTQGAFSIHIISWSLIPGFRSLYNNAALTIPCLNQGCFPVLNLFEAQVSKSLLLFLISSHTRLSFHPLLLCKIRSEYWIS